MNEFQKIFARRLSENEIGVTQLTFIIERSIYIDRTYNIRASNETAIRC